MGSDSMAVTKPARPRKTWPRRVGRALMLLIVGIVAGHWIWGMVAARRLDRLLADLAAKGEPTSAEMLAGTPVPDSANAAVLLSRAAAAINSDDPDWATVDRIMDLELPLTDQETAALAALTHRYAEALSLIDSARELDKVNWGEIFGISPGSSDPKKVSYVTLQRELALLLRAAALSAHAEHDDAAALRRLRDTLRVSTALDSGATLIPHLSANGVAAMAGDWAAQIAADMTDATSLGDPNVAEQARQLIGELLDEKAMTAGAVSGMWAERIYQIASLRAMAKGNLPGVRLEGADGQSRRISAVCVGYILRPLLLADASLVTEHDAAIISALQTSRTRCEASQIMAAAPQKQYLHPLVHMGACILMTPADSILHNHFRVRADRRLSAAALAIALYRADHNQKLPATLSQLVPKYLPAVPSDPFANGVQPLGYRPDAPVPVVYSVGQDAVDNGGSDAPRRKSMQDPSRWQRIDAVVYLRLRPRQPPTTLPDGNAFSSPFPGTFRDIESEPESAAPKSVP